MSFYTGTQTEVLYTLPAAVTKNTYTTQACMSALGATNQIPTLPGGYFAAFPNGIGRAVLVKAWGTIATTSAATFAGALAVDTTAATALNPITMFTAVAPTAAVTAQWEMEAWITCQANAATAGTTLQVNGKWQQSTVATGGALQSAAPWTAMFAGNLTGLPSNVPLFVELFGTWSASASGNTTTLQQMFLFGLN
jgi:hypothetical protein